MIQLKSTITVRAQREKRTIKLAEENLDLTVSSYLNHQDSLELRRGGNRARCGARASKYRSVMNNTDAQEENKKNPEQSLM